MRMYVSRFIRCALLACASLFASVSFADALPVTSYARVALADIGAYGSDAAKFTVEQAYMASLNERTRGSTAKMTAESNGFRLADLTKSGVAESMTGIGAGAPQVV